MLPGCRMMIYVEGEATEIEYLCALRSYLGIAKELVSIEHPRCTDAPSLVEYAIRTKNRMSKRRASGEPAIDQWWVLADTEGKPGPLREAAQRARSSGILMAASDPAIELWLLLHFKFTTRPYQTSDEVISDLSRLLSGYSPKNKHPNMEILLPLVPKAICNAQKLRKANMQSGQTSPFTDCDLLVQEINNQARKDRRVAEYERVTQDKLTLFNVLD